MRTKIVDTARKVLAGTPTRRGTL